MISLGVPFLDSDFMHYFDYASNISSVYSVLSETQKFKEYLNED